MVLMLGKYNTVGYGDKGGADAILLPYEISLQGQGRRCIHSGGILLIQQIQALGILTE